MNAADSRIAHFFPRRPRSGGFLATRTTIARPTLGRRTEITITGAFLTGLACVVYGFGSIYRPLGFIVAGILLVVLTLAYQRGKD